MTNEVSILYSAYGEPSSSEVKICNLDEGLNGIVNKDTIFSMYTIIKDPKVIKTRDMILKRPYSVIILDCTPCVLYDDGRDDSVNSKQKEIQNYASRIFDQTDEVFYNDNPFGHYGRKPIIAVIGSNDLVDKLAANYVCNFKFAPVRKNGKCLEVYCSGLVGVANDEKKGNKVSLIPPSLFLSGAYRHLPIER